MRTRVGYCGGTTERPTYRTIGDHAEAIQIDFDPDVITYEQLLELFWTTHNPCRQAHRRQYMSAIFYADAAQLAAIERTRAEFVDEPDRVQTEVAPLHAFWIAEDYHQKYRLRAERTLLSELQAIYPDAADFTASTAAARVNGWLDGHGSSAQLEREIGRLGLSAAGQQLLRRAAR